ncbi:MAG: c-type cytochrome domain-containing protein [Sideroxyarcus sp.]|nr:c-type cytochrome domain-containing protein [Sideroxyarcus sp.]
MKTRILVCGIMTAALSFNAAAADDTSLPSAQGAMRASSKSEVSFKNDVMPILQDHCISCHAPGTKGVMKSGLDLTSYENLMKGTVFGPVVIPGDSASSTFTKLLTGTNKGLKMPMGLNAEGTLDIQYIMTLRNWVKQGAKNN